MRMRGISCIPTILIILLISDIISVSADNEDSPSNLEPYVELVLDEHVLEIQSNPSRFGRTRTTGAILYHFPDCDYPSNFYYFKMEIELDVPGIEVDSYLLEANKLVENDMKRDYRVYINIYAEPDTRAFSDLQIPITLTWWNNNETESGSFGPYNLSLTVQPYVEFSSIIVDDLNEITEQVGKWEEVHFEIHNQGNYLTEFKFEDFENDDIEFKVPEEGLILDVDQKGTVTIKVRQKEGLGKTNHIDLNITGYSMDRERTLEYSFVFRSTPGRNSLTTPYFCYLWLVIIFIILAILLIIHKSRNRNR